MSEATRGKLDRYLDLVLEARVASAHSIQEWARGEARCGSLAARRAAIRWTEGGESFSGFITACDDGWQYWLLTTIVYSDSSTSALAALEQLEASFIWTKDAEQRIGELAAGLSESSPWISLEHGKLLARELMRRRLGATEARQFGAEMMNKGRGLLKPTEQTRLESLVSTALSALSDEEYEELNRLREAVEEARDIGPDGSSRAQQLLRKAMISLAPADLEEIQRLEMEAVIERCINNVTSQAKREKARIGGRSHADVAAIAESGSTRRAGDV